LEIHYKGTQKNTAELGGGVRKTDKRGRGRSGGEGKRLAGKWRRELVVIERMLIGKRRELESRPKRDTWGEREE